MNTICFRQLSDTIIKNGYELRVLKKMYEAMYNFTVLVKNNIPIGGTTVCDILFEHYNIDNRDVDCVDIVFEEIENRQVACFSLGGEN